MGHQVIKQPNGAYCIFSTVVDDVILFDASKQDIIDFYIKKETEDITTKMNKIFDSIDCGDKPYCQFTKTFDEMVSLIEEVHGKSSTKRLLKYATK